ncbi:MAG TPA: hypothetical protein PLJ27_12005 [Polyangiaceae bacterium]|nr:hypothetical protein [Polyangiaceae bacterium]HNZ24759.1 hypothetical protein [Polyangiaceae bacterium]HOD24497.1 hypothetical protein [Polyangiaceae bacterium]HOE51620.1 hypothetical protein [Polyangiaceae bacterium]HOH02880.1 hypothetical protein [Polyangiaceae bacterium]
MKRQRTHEDDGSKAQDSEAARLGSMNRGETPAGLAEMRELF